MKVVYLLITFFLFGLCCEAQSINNKSNSDSAKPFRLSISKFNHAERIYEGTYTYILTDTSVKIINTSFSNKESIVLSKPLSKFSKSIIQISRTNLSMLKGNYSNNCVMITSGDEYSLSFESGSSSKDISLHHYYVKKIEELIKLVNDNLPAKHKLIYLPKETEQDCNP